MKTEFLPRIASGVQGGGLSGLAFTQLPLGCARLRMACLPVVTDDPSDPEWKAVPAHIPPEERPQGFKQHYDLDGKTVG